MGDSAGTPRRGRARAWSIFVAVLLAFAGSLVAPVSAQAVDTTCGYGTGGPAADTFCWFDMSGYSEAAATSPAGQPFDVALGGGYAVSFTLHKSNVAGLVSATVTARNEPLEPRFAFGTAGYVGIPGNPILYSNDPGGGTKGLQLTLSDISVVDGTGAAVTGYRFVIADAENNVAGENFTWTSDVALDTLAVLNPANPNGCSLPLAGTGTTTVTCTGAGGGGGPYNGVVVGSEAPSFISLSMSTFARSGVAFAIQTAKLTLAKSVVGRVNDADSFDIAVTSPEGSTVGSASTGAADTAGTGSLVVLPSASDGDYTLGESATGGTPTVLSNYEQSWACTNETAGSSTPLPSGSGTSKTVTPAAGDDIRCTITNTASARSLTLSKQAGAATDVDGDGVIGAGDVIPYSFEVTNTGDLALEDVGISEVAFDGTGPLTVSCPSDQLAVSGVMTCSADYELTQADVDRGSVSNTATAHGTPPGGVLPIESGSSSTLTTLAAAPALTLVKTADRDRVAAAGEVVTFTFTVTNTGNVTLFDPAVDETDFSGSGATPDPDCRPGVTQLAPGDSLVCEAQYTVTSADLAAGTLRNTATASAEDADDLEVLSLGSTATVLLGAMASTGAEIGSALGIALALLTVGGVVIAGTTVGRRGRVR